MSKRAEISRTKILNKEKKLIIVFIFLHYNGPQAIMNIYIYFFIPSIFLSLAANVHYSINSYTYV